MRRAQHCGVVTGSAHQLQPDRQAFACESARHRYRRSAVQVGEPRVLRRRLLADASGERPRSGRQWIGKRPDRRHRQDVMRLEDLGHAPRDASASFLRVHVGVPWNEQSAPQHEPELVAVSRPPAAQRRQVKRRRLRKRDEIPGRHHLDDAESEAHVIDRRVLVAERLDRRLDALTHLGIAAIPEIAGHADAESAQAAGAVE